MTSETERYPLITLTRVSKSMLIEMCMFRLIVSLADNRDKLPSDEVAALFAQLGIDPDDDNELFGVLGTTRAMAEFLEIDADRYLQWLRSEIAFEVYKQPSVEAIFDGLNEVGLWNRQVIDLFRLESGE